STLLEKLKFVQIVLGDEQDPHQVFDSLNAQGVRLENKDLIRNIVFQRLADRPIEAEALYNGKWIPFDQELGTSLDGYFSPSALVPRSAVTKSTLLSTLRGRWAGWTPDSIVDDLRVYVPPFKALTADSQQFRDSLTHSQPINELVSRLHRMPVPVT